MDYNVVGMWRRIGGERVPDFERIVVLDITDESDGNGLGVGIADFTTRRLYDKLDFGKMYLNGLISGALGAIKVPIVNSTLELDELWVSDALIDEVTNNPQLEVLGAAGELDFDANGRLQLVS